MKQVQNALRNIGIPVMAGVWRATSPNQNPPAQYVVYSTAKTEDSHGMYALVDHEVSTSEARFSALAGSLLRGYAENPENLPVGNCDADIAVLGALEKPDPYYGMGKERFEAQLARRDALRRNLGIPDDQVL